MVAIMHFPVMSHLTGSPLITNSRLFVDFFFLLSGFVIALSYQEKLNSGFGIVPFMTLRLGRLYPLHFITLLATVLIISLTVRLFPNALMQSSYFAEYMPFTNDKQWNWKTVLNHLTLVHGFQSNTDWNGPSWSISVEFFAYFLFAVSVVCLKRNLWKGLLVTVLLGPVMIYGASFADGVNLLNISRGIFGFSMGALLFTWMQKSPASFFLLLNRPKLASFCEFFGLALMVAFISFLTFHDSEKSVLVINRPYFFAPYIYAVVVLIYANQAGIISRFLCTKPFQILGLWSYSIYMLHFLVTILLGWPIKYLNKKLNLNFVTYTSEYHGYIGVEKWQGDLVYVVYFGIVFTLSWMSYKWLEKPTMLKTRQVVNKMRASKENLVVA